MLPLEAYSPFTWWSTMYVNRRGHDVSNPYSLSREAECRSFAALRMTAVLQLTPMGHYAGIPASTHLRNRAICSSGHFPSHGIVPFERRPRMA